MKKILTTIFFMPVVLLAQNQNCGCDAALRYDVYKSERNFYSEMLLAREINSENYKELNQKAGGNLSILGIEVGGSGENVEKIRSLYREKLLNVNISNEITKYESITTSKVSYDAYQSCIQACLKSRSKGVDAYLIYEGSDAVKIEVYYYGEQRAQPIFIKYGEDANTPSTIKVASMTSKVVTISRKSLDGMVVVFESEQYPAVKVTVKDFKPITAIMTVTYKETVTTQGSPRIYVQTSDNNDGKRPGLFDLGPLVANELNVVRNLINWGEGPYRFNGVSSGEKGYCATIMAFKFSSSNGEKLRNPLGSCSGAGCPWVQTSSFLANNENSVAQYYKAFGLPATITYTVETYKERVVDREVTSFTTNKSITFIIPKNSVDAVIHYENGAVPAGQSDAFLQLLGTARETEGLNVYQYIFGSSTKSNSFFIK